MSQAFETAIQRALREVVESFAEQYVAEGLLKKDAIIVDLDNYKPELVEKILTNAILNEAFTEDIAGVTILKTMISFKCLRLMNIGRILTHVTLTKLDYP